MMNKSKKSVILSFVPVLALVFLFGGCKGASDTEISGKKLLDIKSCSSVTLSLCGDMEQTLENREDIDKITDMLLSMTYKKTSHEIIEGGLFLTLSSPDKDIHINVYGKLIIYDNQWYEASEDISDQLHRYFD